MLWLQVKLFWLTIVRFGMVVASVLAECDAVLAVRSVYIEVTIRITFSENRCNYHSKSYYCQPEKFDLQPKHGPTSCKCTKVDLTDSYSAGILVKCTECTTVYKSTQKNSCPKGMKIFSPASRADWKTFLSSAVPLRAPNWIIDVTRPANGCGGCTRHSMKSTTSQQATWRTSDASPWWLRSTTYSAKRRLQSK